MQYNPRRVCLTFRALCYFSTQDDLAVMIEGTDGQYYLQAGAILLPGSYLPFLTVPSITFLIVSDVRMQASGVSKTKLAFHWTQFTRPAMYRNVCIPYLPIPYLYTLSSIAVAR